MKAVLISQLPRHQGCSFESGAGKWAGRVRGSGVSAPHMDSNSSIRCLVFPWRIWRSVLYLSRPALTFSACSTSFCVFLESSRACANSELRACEDEREESEIKKSWAPDRTVGMCWEGLTWSCFLTRSFFWASVRRSSSVCGCATPSLESSALASALLSSCSSCSFSAELPAGTAAVVTLFSSSLVFSRSSWAEIAWREHKGGIIRR